MRGAPILVELGDVFDDLDGGEIGSPADAGKGLQHLGAAQTVFRLEADAWGVLRLEAVEIDRQAKTGGARSGDHQRVGEHGIKAAAAYRLHLEDANAEPAQQSHLA